MARRRGYLMSGGGGPFEPNQFLAGAPCEQWLDARYRITGSGVADAVGDLTVHARDATQSGAARPTLLPTGWSDGGQALDFDGAQQWLSNNQVAPFFTGLPPVSVVALLKQTTLTGSQVLHGGGNAGTSSLLQWMSAGGYFTAIWNRNDAAAVKYGWFGSNPSQERDHLIAWVCDGTSSYIYRNGEKVGPLDTVPAAPTTISACAIGATLTGGVTPGNFVNAKLRNFGVFSRALGEADVSELTRFVHGGLYGSVVCDGNSLTAGFAAPPGQSYPDQLANLLGGRYYVTNVGVGAQATPAMIADFVVEMGPLYKPLRSSIYIAWEVGNDILFGATDVVAVANMWTLCDMASAMGYLPIVVTVTPRVSFNPTQEAYRVSANAMLREQWPSHTVGLIDPALDLRLVDPTDETWYHTDHIHLNPTGYAVIAELAYPVVKTVAP